MNNSNHNRNHNRKIKINIPLRAVAGESVRLKLHGSDSTARTARLRRLRTPVQSCRFKRERDKPFPLIHTCVWPLAHTCLWHISFAILGFVCGPSFGALFTTINASYFDGRLVFDAYTSPGWFILALCVVIFFLVIFCFHPTASPTFTTGDTVNTAAAATAHAPILSPPNSKGLGIVLVLFVIHFFSFAIQETITTPYVLSAYGWSQTDVNLLFVAVGVISLVTSIGIKYLARVVSDYNMLLISLVIGLIGSILLIDSPPFTDQITLPLPRFFAGFALITVAFPFGRNVSLSVFSQLLGPTPQGQWFGYMFAAGAIPRIIGPSWSLFALDWACKIEHMDCFLGGRTWLEFAVSGTLFAGGIVLALMFKKEMRPYGETGGKGVLA